MRWYPQSEFFNKVSANPHIMESAFGLLKRQCDRMRHGCADNSGGFMSAETFAEVFFQQYDKEYLVTMVDSDEMLDRLGFEFVLEESH